MAWGPDSFESARGLVEERLARHGIAMPLTDAESEARDLVGGLLSNASPQAAELVAEQVIIAVAMRQQYGEPHLTSYQVEKYLGEARSFLNSFFHDPL